MLSDQEKIAELDTRLKRIETLHIYGIVAVLIAIPIILYIKAKKQ